LSLTAIRHGRIKTTLIRAKAVRKYVDKMIGLSKRGDLHARRQALGWMYDKDLVAALFEQVRSQQIKPTSLMLFRSFDLMLSNSYFLAQ